VPTLSAVEQELHVDPGMKQPSARVLDVLPPDHRALVVSELQRRNPGLITELASAGRPTTRQSDAVIDALARALSATYGPGYMPNDYGLAVERAIDAYLEIWPIHR
jgi:hypothetical protein